MTDKEKFYQLISNILKSKSFARIGSDDHIIKLDVPINKHGFLWLSLNCIPSNKTLSIFDSHICDHYLYVSEKEPSNVNVIIRIIIETGDLHLLEGIDT